MQYTPPKENEYSVFIYNNPVNTKLIAIGRSNGLTDGRRSFFRSINDFMYYLDMGSVFYSSLKVVEQDLKFYKGNYPRENIREVLNMLLLLEN